MLERSQRSLSAEDRRILDGWRQQAIGTSSFEAKHTLLGAVAGLVVGFVWLAVFHWGDAGSPWWPVVALPAVGAAVGFAFDYLRHRRELRDCEAAAAAKWDPIIAADVVEHLVAEATRAVRLDDGEADTAWFLQVGDAQILCVWDWSDDATERVEIDLVPGSPPTALKISWVGKTLTPSRAKRLFKRGEREPEQCEVLDGTLDELDGLLRKGHRPKRAPKAASSPTSKLADDVAALGFYKYAAADQIDEIKGEVDKGAHDWYRAAGRSFGADAERLAEGGVGDLLDYMRPALQVEGCDVAEIEESYDERGYTIRIGAERFTLWGEHEGKSSWELTTTRTIALIDSWLASAGSQERVHVLEGGEDAVFVLLTPAMRQTIVESGVFTAADIPERLSQD